MSKAREEELRWFLASVQHRCKQWGFRIECLESYSSLAIFDERDIRPASFPVAAFAKRIGVRVTGLKMQAIMPPE